MNFKSELSVLLFLAVLAVGSFFVLHDPSIPSVPSRLATLLAQQPTVLNLDAPTKTAQCEVRGPLPDHDCTPGAVFPEAIVAEICVPGYTKTVRNVSVSLKKRVYTEYGLAYPQASGTFEADHLIPLELGGNNDISNLFPEAAEPRPGFHEKDLVENYLHDLVCAGQTTLAAAQAQIANDWISVYRSLTPDQLKMLLSEYKF